MNRALTLLLRYQHSASSPETGLSSEAAPKPLTPTRHSRSILSDTAAAEGVPDAIQFVNTTDRQAVYELIRLPDYVDLVIPRGSNEFVQF